MYSTGYDYSGWGETSTICSTGLPYPNRGSGSAAYPAWGKIISLKPGETFSPTPKPNKLQSTFKYMKDEARNFLTEHRTIIFWVAILIVADYWLLEGKLRARLLEIFESIVAKVKKHLEG